ncbi:MAG: nucleotidyltransferase [Oscillospiraceae bacterium]|jgi:hypothetical protein|nr:nucleotidyltransferase [Oscillospiraceae bacterium]MDD3261183.1 sugar phosphate nucleotidyltransferase [Oscillospiraceae bacterium]
MKNREPILVIMAAGMGSRYGGPKQIDPVGMHGEIIIDYSLYDAYRAGFRRVVCIIKKEIEHDFKERIGTRLARLMDVTYVYQQLGDLPAGYAVPQGRQKPWGTAHALLACRGKIDAPFAVINADDYYGPQAFEMMYRWCSTAQDTEKYQYSMVGYLLQNTLTDFGHVARGICTVKDGFLADVHERTRIEKRSAGPAYTEDNGATWHALPGDSTVSMNLWGFTPGFLQELEKGFPPFLDTEAVKNPLKSEYFLPSVVNSLLQAGRADVTVFRSQDRWYGVTYRADKPTVQKAICSFVVAGRYPEHLWGDSAND